MKLAAGIFLFCIVVLNQVSGRLSVIGNRFNYNCQNVFLSGVNFAWNSYGYDFGNGQYTKNSQTVFQNWLSTIATNGGNSVRVWVHVEGYNTPAYDSNGYVTDADSTGTIISDMKSLLNAAQAKNILVIFVLWNGASLGNQNTVNLFWDQSKLQTYINNALTVR